jgi:hypothetical protein
MRRKGSRRRKRRGRNNSSMILTSYLVIKKGFAWTSGSRKFIVIPAAPACQAHGGGAGLTGIMQAIVLQKFNKRFFGKTFCATV